MKRIVFCASIITLGLSITAQELSPIALMAPNLKNDVSLMEALTKRSSVREYKDSSVSLQDLSNLLWAEKRYQPSGKKGTYSSIGN